MIFSKLYKILFLFLMITNSTSVVFAESADGTSDAVNDSVNKIKACKPPEGGCTDGKVWDTERCKCTCDTLTDWPGACEGLSPGTKLCMGDHQLHECVNSCQTNFIEYCDTNKKCEDGGCVCLKSSCADGKTVNSENCECTCPDGRSYWDGDGCVDKECENASDCLSFFSFLGVGPDSRCVTCENNHCKTNPGPFCEGEAIKHCLEDGTVRESDTSTVVVCIYDQICVDGKCVDNPCPNGGESDCNGGCHGEGSDETPGFFGSGPCPK